MRFLILFLAVAGFSQVSQASYTSCSGEDFFYYTQSGDFGTPPPPGTLVAKSMVVKGGEVLLDHKYLSGDEWQREEYIFLFLPSDDDRDVFKSEGGPREGGLSIFEVTGILLKFDDEKQTYVEESRHRVVCKNVFAGMVM